MTYGILDYVIAIVFVASCLFFLYDALIFDADAKITRICGGNDVRKRHSTAVGLISITFFISMIVVPAFILVCTSSLVLMIAIFILIFIVGILIKPAMMKSVSDSFAEDSAIVYGAQHDLVCAPRAFLMGGATVFFALGVWFILSGAGQQVPPSLYITSSATATVSCAAVALMGIISAVLACDTTLRLRHEGKLFCSHEQKDEQKEAEEKKIAEEKRHEGEVVEHLEGF